MSLYGIKACDKDYCGAGGVGGGRNETLTLREETAQRFLPLLHGTGRDVQGHCPSQRSPHWILPCLISPIT